MIEALLLFLVGTLVILAIIAANGYFVAEEFAYMSVDRTRLAASAAKGDVSAKRALAVTRRNHLITPCEIGPAGQSAMARASYLGSARAMALGAPPLA